MIPVEFAYAFYRPDYGASFIVTSLVVLYFG